MFYLRLLLSKILKIWQTEKLSLFVILLLTGLSLFFGWKVALAVFFILIWSFFQITTTPIAVLAIFLICLIPFFLFIQNPRAADVASVYTYYCLAILVVLEVLKYFQPGLFLKHLQDWIFNKKTNPQTAAPASFDLKDDYKAPASTAKTYYPNQQNPDYNFTQNAHLKPSGNLATAAAVSQNSDSNVEEIINPDNLSDWVFEAIFLGFVMGFALLVFDFASTPNYLQISTSAAGNAGSPYFVLTWVTAFLKSKSIGSIAFFNTVFQLFSSGLVFLNFQILRKIILLYKKNLTLLENVLSATLAVFSVFNPFILNRLVLGQLDQIVAHCVFLVAFYLILKRCNLILQADLLEQYREFEEAKFINIVHLFFSLLISLYFSLGHFLILLPLLLISNFVTSLKKTIREAGAIKQVENVENYLFKNTEQGEAFQNFGKFRNIAALVLFLVISLFLINNHSQLDTLASFEVKNISLSSQAFFGIETLPVSTSRDMIQNLATLMKDLGNYSIYFSHSIRFVAMGILVFWVISLAIFNLLKTRKFDITLFVCFAFMPVLFFVYLNPGYIQGTDFLQTLSVVFSQSSVAYSCFLILMICWLVYSQIKIPRFLAVALLLCLIVITIASLLPFAYLSGL